MKTTKKLAAGMLSLAVLMQTAAAMPHSVPPLRAEAAFVKSIQTRIFEYDFSDFRVLYDTRTGTWYTDAGAEIRTNISVCSIDSENGKASVNFSNERVFANDASGKENKELEQRIKEKVLEPVLAIQPEYEPEFYDKAQQKRIAVPVPVSFPLHYQIEQGTDGHSLKCVIYFGEKVYGTCLFNISPEKLLDPEADLSDFDMKFVKNGTVGTADPFSDAGDSTIDGQKDVADAVLTSRFLIEDEEANMSDLGKELADRNNDGTVSGADVREVLVDITGVPDDDRPVVLPENAVEVRKLKENKDFYQMAQTFGYESAFALEERFKEMDSNVLNLFKCTPGYDEDVWEIAVLENGIPDFNISAIKSIRLTENGLKIQADVQNMLESAWSPDHYLHYQMTVPHGTIPAGAPVYWDLTYAETRLRVPSLHYISIENESGVRLDNVSGSKGTELHSPEFAGSYPDSKIAPEVAYAQALTQGFYAEQFLDQSETDDPELRVKLASGQDVIRVYLENFGTNAKAYGLKGAGVDANGTLHLDMAVLYPYLRIVPCSTVNRFDFCCKDGALPRFDNIIVHLQEYNTDLEVLASLRDDVTGLEDEYDAFLADTRMTVYVQQEAEQSGEGIRADVQTGAVPADQPLPQCMRRAEPLGADEYAVEIYRTQEDTEDTALQEILNQGKDIIAFYYHGTNSDLKFGIDQAVLYQNRYLLLNISQYQPNSHDNQMQLYRVLMITENGKLPETLLTNVTMQHFFPISDAYENTDRYAAFLETVHNPLYITEEAALPDIPDDTVIAQEKAHTVYLWESDMGTNEWIQRFGLPTDLDENTPQMQIRWNLVKGNYTDTLELALLQKDGAGYDLEIQELYLKDGVLHIVAGEYYERYFGRVAPSLFWRSLNIKHGSLNGLREVVVDTVKTRGYADRLDGNLAVHGEGWARFMFDLPETLTVQHPQSDSIRAIVQTGHVSEPEKPEYTTEAYLDQYAAEIYRTEADTNDAALQRLLAQGKDIIAVYYYGRTGSLEFGAESAAISGDGVLSLNIARYEPGTQTCDMCLHRMLLITDDGELPENLTVNVTEKVYEDTLTEDGAWIDAYPEFFANTKNPLLIPVE